DDVAASLARHAGARLGFGRVAVVVHHRDAWAGVVDERGFTTFVESHVPAGDLVADVWRSATPILLRSLDDALLDSLLPDARNLAVVPIAADGDEFGVAVGEWGGGGSSSIPSATVHAFAQAALHAALSLRNRELLAEV